MVSLVTELQAHDVMVADPVYVQPSTTIRQLARVFEENAISGAPVVGREGALIGVVSKSDLIRRCSEGIADIPAAYLFEVLFDQGTNAHRPPRRVIPEALVCVEDFMTHEAVTATPDTPIAVIARLMFDKRIHRVIGVDECRLPLASSRPLT